MDTGLLVLRTILGATMAAHGAQKLFGWFGGPGLAGTGGWLGSMGFRPARLHAIVSGSSELGGGLLIALGLLTPLGAAAVAGVMLVAIATVHWSNGFFNSAGGYEFNLLIIASALTLAFAGPGSISLDDAFGWSLVGAEWGVGAAVASALTAAFVLATRKQPALPKAQAREEQHAA